MDRTITPELIEECAVYPARNLTFVRVLHRATGTVREGRVTGMDHQALQAARAEALARIGMDLAG